MALNTTFVAGTTVITAAHLNGLQSAWAAWTPTVTAESGTFTSASGSGRYQQIGKTILWSASLTITTAGTGAGGVKFTLPVAAHASAAHIGSGRESAVTGVTIWVIMNGVNGFIYRYDNASIIGSGRTIVASGSYEAA